MRFYTLLAFGLIAMGATISLPVNASTSGIDTPTGVYGLPISVQGEPGMDLSVPYGSAPGTVPTAHFYGPTNFPGPVGIGTTAPQYQLDIVGDLRASGQALINIPSCPLGQVMAGVTNGQPVCRKLSCRQVAAYDNVMPYYVSNPVCDEDEILTGGGGASEIDSPNPTGCNQAHSFMHMNAPSGNGWVVDAFRNDWSGEACTYGVAICCKLK